MTMNANQPVPVSEPSELVASLAASSEAAVIADVVAKSIEPQVLQLADDTSAPFPRVLLTPKHLRVESIQKFVDELRATPRRRKGLAHFSELASFIAHAKRFADVGSALFAHITDGEASMTSVLNYHQPKDGDPRFGDHRGVYSFPVSEEWDAWTGLAGRWLSQTEFAELLEERIVDVRAPSGAVGELALSEAFGGVPFASPSRLLELSRGLSVRVESKVTNAQKLQTGEATIAFSSTHTDEAGGELKVPGAFLLAIPIFRGGDLFTLAARLRYRVLHGAITWGVAVHQTSAKFTDAVREACRKAEAETDLPLFYGSPES